MDKICIVKLRKRMGYTSLDQEELLRSHGSSDAGRAVEAPVLISKPTGVPELHDERHRSENRDVEADKTVALSLTREQMQTLASNPRLMSLLNNKFTGDFGTIKNLDEPLIIQFQFASMIPLRLLKSSEVVQMLSISRYSLRKVVREGNLKSYKIGQLRRFLLDDILSYLHDNRELDDLPCNSPAESSCNGSLEQRIQEV